VGTRNVVRAALRHDVRKLVLISTDKAVNPASIMGVTKRIAELLVVGAAQRHGRAMMAVRFGNVLGSRGSVIPSFQQQIAAGGPVTVTHPEMIRYFMTIPEAVSLVLHASILGKGGEAFVFDMGNPIRIVDLATDLIRLSGLQPGRDIKIAYTGVRPGEKLYEELFLSSEAYQRTDHARIFVAKSNGAIDLDCIEQTVNEMEDLAKAMDIGALVARIRALVPEYHAAAIPTASSPARTGTLARLAEPATPTLV
jgi:FlaA1/EpsC-like NDP-sugar epimerase